MVEVSIPGALSRSKEIAWISKETRDKMAELFKLYLAPPRDLVFDSSRGEDSLMLVMSGSVKVMKNSSGGMVSGGLLAEGELFGVEAFYENKLKEQVLLVSDSSCLIASAPAGRCAELLKEAPEDCGLYDRICRHYAPYRFVREATTFGSFLSLDVLLDFASALELRSYTAGEPVFLEGAEPDGYYLILHGDAEVRKVINGTDIKLAELRPGDYFGELALTTSAKRAATIQAAEGLECYFLSRKSFEDLLKREPKLQRGIEEMAKLAY